MTSEYSKKLLARVITASEGNDWSAAVTEWVVSDSEEDVTATTSCICGKEHIRYLFEITNQINGHQLFPIGSQCIKRFHQTGLTQSTTLFESLFKLRRAILDGEYIQLNSTYFTKRLLAYLDEQNVFAPSAFNNWNGHADYEFLLKMFLKRDKDAITDKQQGKINALIMGQIFPYLKSTLKEKLLSSLLH